MPEETRIFHFHSDAVGEDTFQLGALSGQEEISTPYEFELDLLSKKVDVPLDKMLNNPAWIAIRQSVPLSGGKRGTRIFKIHGLLSSFEVLEKVNDFVKYHAVLVPRVWKCSLITQCRVFQDMTIPEVLKKVLSDAGGAGLKSGDDFDLRLTKSYAKREFIIQYNETDLDFLHRWMEHEGIFYFFEQAESGEKIVFGDSTSSYVKLPGDPKIPYRPDPASRDRAAGASSEESLQEESVHKFHCLLKKLPKEVVLKDFNYRSPSVDIKSKATVNSPVAEGLFYMYGEHYKDKAQGDAIAKVRAEEFQCRDKTFDGTSDHKSFRPGTLFSLSEHYRPDFNASYLIVGIRHKLTQGTVASGGSLMSYTNEFDAIPGDDVFRPERRTPWPSIHGVINAKVDAGGSGDYAEIDDQGRYKVKLPFDLTDAKEGKASRFIRMAQPYAGADMGMHFPLHKDTEVLLTFIDGDVDRPIISAAVPNAETNPPVTSKNQTQCALHTGGGSKMVIEDTDGNQRVHISTPTKGTFFQMGSKSDSGGGGSGEGGGSTGAPAPGAEDGVSMGTEADINFQSARDYIHRTGGSVTIETTKNELKITKGDSAEETHGNKREWTKGNSEAETIGNSKETTTGNKEEQTTGNSKSTTVGNTDETFTGTKTSKSLSAENEMTLGAKNSMSASAEAETTVGAKSEIFGGIKFESTVGLSTEANKGGKVTLCDLSEIKTAAQKMEEVTGPNEMKGGTITIDATTALTLEGGTTITLKCGGSEITLGPAEITIKAPSITLNADGKLEHKSGGILKIQGSMLDVSGQAMHK
ncbi:MAG TPA: type VI secretion system tip protein TssI/VgrG [Planctomycetota bacterium]|nr:type VI secretion system tip protein TssI/VgrG [Planctomycetota bacterium]